MRRNPVIADLFHRMKYMERRRSGLRKIVSETEKLPGYTAAYKSEFSSPATDFRVILKNVNYNMCGASVHVAAHDTSVISKQNLLLEFCANPKSRDEMQAYIDVSRQTQKQKPEIHYRSFQITKKQGTGSHLPLSCFFSFQIYSHHLPIHPILDRKFQILHLTQQPDRSQRQPHRTNQKCHQQQNKPVLRRICNQHCNT